MIPVVAVKRLELVVVYPSRGIVESQFQHFKEILQDLVKGTHTCQTYESTLSGNSLEYRVQSKILFAENIYIEVYRVQNTKTH